MNDPFLVNIGKILITVKAFVGWRLVCFSGSKRRECDDCGEVQPDASIRSIPIFARNTDYKKA
jgi:hypothetical protein